MANAEGSLVVPRVNVEWGSLNLTCPNTENGVFAGFSLEGLGPLVYDVRVSMEDQGQTPTGSMKWNPSGLAFGIYQACIEQFRDRSIVVTFYYVTGRSITFEFYWGGQSEVYGKDLEVTVKLNSLLDGLINANFYATVQADKEEKGKSHKESLEGLRKQFGLAGISGLEQIIRFTNQADKDMSEAIVKANYNDGSTFMDAVQNLVKDNGNNVFFNNIKGANAVVYTPFSYESQVADSFSQSAATGQSQVVNIPEIGNGNSPDPRKRYGYFIGPGIIQSFTRNMEWQPPQKSQEINAIMARKAEIEREAKEQDPNRKGRRRRNRTNGDNATDATAANATAPSGVYGSKTSTNIRSSNNYLGPRKQDIFTKERSAKLSLTTIMCPALTGLKPLDILYIPAYSGDYLEDWVVSSVEYQQTQGGIDLAIQATRTYGTANPMGERDAEIFTLLAQRMGLMAKDGNPASLESWVKYGWGTYIGFGRKGEAPAVSSGVSPVSQAAPASQPKASADLRLAIDKKYPLLPLDKSASVLSKNPNGSVSVKFYDGLFYTWLTTAAKNTTVSADIQYAKSVELQKVTFNRDGGSLNGVFKSWSDVEKLYSYYSHPANDVINRYSRDTFIDYASRNPYLQRDLGVLK